MWFLEWINWNRMCVNDTLELIVILELYITFIRVPEPKSHFPYRNNKMNERIAFCGTYLNVPIDWNHFDNFFFNLPVFISYFCAHLAHWPKQSNPFCVFTFFCHSISLWTVFIILCVSSKCDWQTNRCDFQIQVEIQWVNAECRRNQIWRIKI